MDKHGIEVIFWDFDGVILDSNKVRDQGFIEVLKEFPDHDVDQLLLFHKANGGLSRYVKFRYFFEKIRNEEVSQEIIMRYAEEFSIIMKRLLIDKKLLIQETIQYIDQNYNQYAMHIVSGSDQQELRFLCHELGIDHYFRSIQGSPTPKTDIIYTLIKSNDLNKKQCVLIGDSKNDYNAAIDNGIKFVAYNNKEIEMYSSFNFSFS